MTEPKVPRPILSNRLALIALDAFFPDLSVAEKAALQEGLAESAFAVYHLAPPTTKSRLLTIVQLLESDPEAAVPTEAVDWLRDQLGRRGLEAWLRTDAGVPESEAAARVTAWLAGLTEGERRTLLVAGVRHGSGAASQGDHLAIRQSFDLFIGKETSMSTTFYFDPRGLPRDFNNGFYQTQVERELADSFGLPKTGHEVEYAAIIGMLLLDEQFAPDSFGFRSALQKVWMESLGKTYKLNGVTPVPNRELYAKVAGIIPDLPGRKDANGNAAIGYQEFASVSRFVIAGAGDVPTDHVNFATQVRIGLDRFVAGAPPSDSLILPPLTGDDGSDVEIEQENIRAVAMVYAAYQLERVRMFHVVDRIAELWGQGMLPIGFDNGGRALDVYSWEGEDRLSEPARRMIYSRVLGAPGGDVSKEVQPNRELESLFLRFLSGLAEYDRQRRIGDLFDSRRRALTLTGEQIRKQGRDLAANASLYGWGGTHFAARRLNAHVATAIDILKLPQVQKAYGVSTPWQVIERVAASDLGGAPNIVKHRTMAESGKAILDLVAKHAKVWSATTGLPLFPESTVITGFDTIVINPEPQTTVPGPSDIPAADQEALMRHTQYWLAVNGVADEQVDKLSQPADTVYAPSLPSLGGASQNGSHDAIEKIRQMIQSGAAPSLDQLKQALPMS